MSAALKLAEAGHALMLEGRFELARQAVELALAVDAAQPNAHTLKAHLLEREGDFAAALAHWRAAARLAPGPAGNRFNLALALLGSGALAEGFALQESRLENPAWSSIAAFGSFAGLRHLVPRPGDELGGRRVLAFTEQGLGDMLWAARFLPALAARCGSLDLACPAALRPLLRWAVLGPPAEQTGAKLNLAALAGQYDAMLPMMSAAHVLGAWDQPAQWLVAEPAKVAAWRARFAAAVSGRPIVGVVWRANPASASGAARTFPPAVLQGIGQAGVVNLQGGDPLFRGALAAALPGVFDPLADGEPGLADYAAMVAATDLLITADTMAAHLAGAIGHPAWVAVPAVPNFYWGQAGETSPWYPGLRLFRQAAGEDWTAAGARIAAALRRF